MFLGARYSDDVLELFRVELIRSVKYDAAGGNLWVVWTDGGAERRTDVKSLTLVDQIEEGLHS